MRFAPEPPARTMRLTARIVQATFACAILAMPARAWCHERWVPHGLRFPVDHSYFQSMTGEVLIYSLGAAAGVFGLVLLYCMSAPGIVDALTPVSAAPESREAGRSFLSRSARLLVRLMLDGEIQSKWMTFGQKATSFLFAKVPVFVLCLGAYEGWLVMPSFPLPRGDLGDALRVVELVLALWTAIGVFSSALGVVLFAVFGYLVYAYGIAAIDAVPVLATAFFCLFRKRGQGLSVNARQFLGVRISLGVGFFLLGLVNKIYLHDIFIGVGDQFPEIVMGPQEMFPGLTREAWSFTTAIGEMVFGLLLLFGVFNRITTLILTFVFANFVFVFGWAEIVHVYPIAGFLLLFFRTRMGTTLDGLVFRANVTLWHWMRRTSSRVVHGGAVGSIAVAASVGCIVIPLVLVTEIVPVLAGTAVPRGYRKPPPAPPASQWARVQPSSAATSSAPHADHEPRHDGVVTMIGDNHVEIVVRANGTISLYASDAVRKPIPPSEVTGTMRIERKGQKTTIPLRADASGALAGTGPVPTETAEYTYFLKVRGIPASMTLSVPPGGTSSIRRDGSPARR